jgi:CBS domain-containing protein
MVTVPAVHPAWSTIGELRAFFDDDHVHMALLVDDELVGTIERTDLATELGDRAPAREVAALDGRTISPDEPLSDAHALMMLGGRRRLVVTSEGSRLLGLLCLKADGSGFCSDSDVASRRQDRRSGDQMTTSSRRP